MSIINTTVAWMRTKITNLAAWPTRLNVAILLYVASFTSYVLRVNMSINILAMVDSNNNTNDAPDYGPRFDWNADDQSNILGAYFWGYLLTQIPAGILADLFGGRYIIGVALVLSSIATILIPFVADRSCSAVIALRFFIGLFGGCVFPAIQSLISKWAPQEEKGKFASIVVGSTLGAVVTWPIAGWLVVYSGWASAFYVPAILTLLVSVLWFYTVYNRPAEHPRISSEEKEYINSSVGEGISEKRIKLPPLGRLVTSLPLWSLVVLHYGGMWTFYIIMIGAPKYVHEVLNIDWHHVGLVAGLPYLALFLTSFLFGAAMDWLLKGRKYRITFIRKCFCVFSHFSPGFWFIVMEYIGSSPYACIAVITIAFAFSGASVCTSLQNIQELAPNYSAIIFAIVNVVSSTNGITAPMVIARFTQEKNTVREWNIIFRISSMFYIMSAIIFLAFGTSEVQDWNEPDANRTKGNAKKLDFDESGHIGDTEI